MKSFYKKESSPHVAKCQWIQTKRERIMHTLISLMKALLLNVKRLRRLQHRFDVERMRWEDRSSLCCGIKTNPLNSPVDLAVIKGQTWHKE